jgi:hypothetical protein
MRDVALGASHAGVAFGLCVWLILMYTIDAARIIWSWRSR